MVRGFFQQFVLKDRIKSMLITRVIILFIFGFTLGLPAAEKKSQNFYDDLFSVTFVSENDGWACGRWGKILHTEDGGKSWIPQSSKTDFTLSSIYFVDGKNGWAVGDQGTIINTTDGGKTWVSQKSPVPFFLMKVHFVTPLKGWIVTERTHILLTTDGGKTWRVQFKEEDFILQSISFCDPLNGWVVGEYGYIYHTGDGGVTWKRQAGHFEISSSTGDVVGDAMLFDVVAIDPKTAWAVGIDSTVIRTVDGGKNWRRVEAGIPKTQLFCVTTDKKNATLIGGKGVFLSSNNMGHTWQSPKFEPPITYSWIYGMAQRGSGGFVAVGGEGAIYINSSNIWHRVKIKM
jgi:photosystem II stability/assembly factor-like uncharacterized protein